MNTFIGQSQFAHGTPAKIGILLTNLGTPDAPTATAVRRYLKQFLSDPRVVEIPKALWWLILNGIILNTRPAKSAAKYACIWTKEGSPLLVNTLRQASMLRGYLGERQVDVQVEVGMRYGNPSMQAAWDKLIAANCTKILVLPLYPQYAGSTTATAFDEVMRLAQRSRNVPELRFVRNYHDDASYIKALKQRVLDFWQTNGRGDFLLMSFHGVPQRTLLQGDPYHCECYKTARLLAYELGLTEGRWGLAFQSRFGRAKWLQPYTSQTLHELPKKGVKALDVLCPGFTSDCLETLEEIAIEGKQEFLTAGGTQYHYIPALNDTDAWIHALASVAQRHLQGWPVDRLTDRDQQAARTAELQLQQSDAKRLGAAR